VSNTKDSRESMQERDGQWRAPGQGGATEVPEWLRQLVWWMDSAFRLPGTSVRIGLDPILGLVLPGIGDMLGAIPSLLLLSLASRKRVPIVVLLRMVLNVAMDSAIGAIPILGDIFDGTFHANEKNLELLDRYASEGRPARARDYFVVALAILVAASCIVLPVVLLVMLVKALAGG
jgi:hypothetical protein